MTQNRRGIHGLANLHSETQACSGVSDDMGGGVWRDEEFSEVTDQGGGCRGHKARARDFSKSQEGRAGF